MTVKFIQDNFKSLEKLRESLENEGYGECAEAVQVALSKLEQIFPTFKENNEHIYAPKWATALYCAVCAHKKSISFLTDYEQDRYRQKVKALTTKDFGKKFQKRKDYKPFGGNRAHVVATVKVLKEAFRLPYTG